MMLVNSTIRLITLLLVGAIAAIVSRSGHADESPTRHWRWVQEEDRSVALADEQGDVWRFNFGPEQMKPNFYPLGLPGMPSLVVDRPADHVWHHGLWFSWKFVNGINFWEPSAEGRPDGRTTWSDVAITPADDYSAKIELKLAYTAPDGALLLAEDRTISVSAPHEDGHYTIDWVSKFRAADSEVKLAAVPVPPAKDGVSWGGYAGLSVRFSTDLKDRQAFTAEQAVEFSEGIFRGRGVGIDYSGKLTNRVAGIAVLDHPSNPRRPANWYVIRTDMSYVNAAVLLNEPMIVKAGERFTLRYRLFIHPESWDAARLKAEYQKLAEE